MPTAERAGASLYYETAGAGETVAFVADAGLGAWSWGWQHRAVAGPYRALVFDARGTGRSEVGDGIDADALVADLDAVLRAAEARTVHLVGLGTGGLLALRYALDHGRVASLALAGTPAHGGALERSPYESFCGGETARGLSERFAADRPEVVAQIAAWRESDDAPEAAWRAHLDALSTVDCRDRRHEVTVPALVCHGERDGLVPASAGEALADGLPRGEWREFEGAGHLVTVERSRPLNDTLLAHLDAA